MTFFFDSGAVYSVLPERVWRKLESTPRRDVAFSLADGRIITRDVSECAFEIAGMSATSPVVLGRAEEGPLLGAIG